MSYFNRIRYRFMSANSIAKIKGVKFGKYCKFRTINFGSEPYLIEVGDYVSTSSNVTFITHDGAVEVLRNLYSEYKSVDMFGRIKIGSNVFIGMNSTILPSTLIEDNVIIGANSLVRGTLKSNSVYAGVPVKRICSLEEYKNKNKKRFIYTKHMDEHKKKKLIQEVLFNG